VPLRLEPLSDALREQVATVPDANPGGRAGLRGRRPSRQAWAERQPTLNPNRLAFLDETWATTNMTRPHGRAPKGERLQCTVPQGHWHTTTFLCGVRTSGLVAPLVLDGAINGAAFLAYIQQFLILTLAPEVGSG